MLRTIIGKAGTGKSSFVMGEIREAVRRGEGGYILLVPEQYSHEAERELCRLCGDSLSLYAEVLSFTGLARRIASELGGGAVQYLDKGGRLLCMALATEGLYSRLKLYAAARRRVDLQSLLLSAVDELKAACVDADKLREAATLCDGTLSDKLSDLALILEAYDAIAANGKADPTERLTVLAGQIEQSGFGKGKHIYIDGFTDFTAQEKRVIEALLTNGAELCLCIGCDDEKSGSEVFDLGRRTLRSFADFCRENDIPYTSVLMDGDAGKSPALRSFADNLFRYSEEHFDCPPGTLELYRALDPMQECELAAARCITLVREQNCRWRDIAVAVRGFDNYRLLLESTFSHYGVPLYTARKNDIASQSLVTLIASVYDIVGGWEIADMLAYMRTGLTGLTEDECDCLENYVLLWQLRGSAWTGEDWRLHPQGFAKDYDEETFEQLRHINRLRRTVAAPLAAFAEKCRLADTAFGQAQALAELLETLDVAGTLEKRSQSLSGQAAQECGQLWDITVNALEQCAAVLGDTGSDTESFGKLLLSMLSRYDVGTIPASLDSVTAGDFDRMRRRSIRHLIVLGASDERLPGGNKDTGIFSSDEKRRLTEFSIDLGGETELWREFSVIYNCLTLPSETLFFSYPEFNASGEQTRPAFAVNRAKKIFDLEIRSADMADCRMNAASPALELAACAFRGGSTAEHSAKAYFTEAEPARMEALQRASEMSRGRLSPDSVRALYGDELRLSASRIDKFASCRFSYFMQYGLRAKPREPAGFNPPEFGTFLHTILQNVAQDVSGLGGFPLVDDGKLGELTDKYVKEYIHEKLNDFKEKSRRFEYLFRRLISSVRRIVLDMAAELRCSDFVPLSFELDFGDPKHVPPVTLGEGEEKLTLIGVADRVDGWVKGDRIYLRVVDYKTGYKKFSLSDVLHGMGLQMLLYLFSLGEVGQRLYGYEPVPAGVLYIPARDKIISLPADPTDPELQKERTSALRRSGLILGDPEILEAMEHGDSKRYLPITVRSKDGLATAEQLGLLEKHINKTLCDMARELHRGSIAADPYYRRQEETACINCDYLAACRFSDGENGEHHRLTPTLSADKVWNVLSSSVEC